MLYLRHIANLIFFLNQRSKHRRSVNDRPNPQRHQPSTARSRTFNPFKDTASTMATIIILARCNIKHARIKRPAEDLDKANGVVTTLQGLSDISVSGTTNGEFHPLQYLFIYVFNFIYICSRSFPPFFHPVGHVGSTAA